ncbi:MAG: sporulation integral membrane protein YtvI [Clostridiales bacterium]|nr:sporulation integral membrane protein YtvI [Clostridiales bacterium]
MVMDFSYWFKVIKKIFVFLFSILLIYMGFKISIYYIPFLIAFILSLIMEPIIRFCMKKLKMRRKLSAILIFTIILAIIVGLITLGVITLVSETANFLGNINVYFEKMHNTSQNLISKFDFSKIQLSNELNTILSNSTGEIITTASNAVKNILTKILNTLTSLPTIGLYIVITILALYFMCTDKIYILDQIEHHLPELWVKKITKHMHGIIRVLGCYLKAQLMLVLISFIISLVGLYIFSIIGMNVNYPLLTAIGIAIVDALPIFGSGTVMIPWAIWSAFNGNITLGISLLILWIIMSIVRQIIEPKIVSGQIGIHPIFTLIAMYTGFRFMGFIGVFLGPIILIILKNIYESRIDKGFVKSIFEGDC